MFIINSSFIGGYKLGDNINHNLQTLTPLYAAYDQADAKTRRLLCKPIILIIVSVLEAYCTTSIIVSSCLPPRALRTWRRMSSLRLDQRRWTSLSTISPVPRNTTLYEWQTRVSMIA